jgi:hypothetical protein
VPLPAAMMAIANSGVFIGTIVSCSLCWSEEARGGRGQVELRRGALR